MPKIQVTQAFTFTDKHGVAEHFAVGQHSVSKEVAEHPYTAYHIAPADPADVAKAAKKAAAEKDAAELAEAQRIAAAQVAADAK